MGIPFYKSQGFPKLSPATSQIGNSLYKMSVLTVEYCGLFGPLKRYFFYISFVYDHLSAL